MKAKKMLAMLLCASMVLSTVSMTALGADEPPAVMPISETQQTKPVTTGYGDSADSWAAPSIERWSAAGVVKGDQNGNFNHTAKLSCAELAQIFVNMFGLTAKAENTFADLKGDEWYADAVLKCVAAGILKGDGTNINAQRDISRQETMVMFGRAVGITPATKPDLSKFTDAAGVATWAAGYLAPLAAMGILAGSGDGTINATGGIDRASTVSLLDKAVATYVTAPGEYKVENANQFVVVNAAAKTGEIVISGTAAGVTVAAGTGETKVVARDLKADTVKVDGVAALSLEGKSTVGEVVANATGAVSIASGVTVTTVTANAAAAITNSGTIKALVANASAAIDNKGTITKADIKADGVVLGGTKPTEMTVAEGTKNPTSSTGKEVKPVAPPSTDDEYIAVSPSITVMGQSRAFKGDLFKEEAKGATPSFIDSDRVFTSTALSLKKGDYNYKNVRLVVEFAAADKDKFQAIMIDERGDSDATNDVAYNIANPAWGAGFELEDDTMLIYLVGNAAVGNYPATIKLVDLNNNNAVITSTSISVPVIDITGKVALIRTNAYATMEEAGKAAKAGDMIALLGEAAQVKDEITVSHGVVVNVLRGAKLTVPAGKKLTLKGNLANDGTVVNNGTLALAGDSVGNGNVINMGPFTNTGTIEIAASAGKDFESLQNIFLNVEELESSGTITNHGHFITGLFGISTLSDTSTMTVEENGTVTVGLGGTLTVETDVTVTIKSKGTMNVVETGLIENKGQIEIANGGKLVLGDEDAAPSPSPDLPQDESEALLTPVLLNAEGAMITNNGTIENYSGFKNNGAIQIGTSETDPPADREDWMVVPMLMNEGDLQNHGTITNHGGIANRGLSENGVSFGFFLNHGIIDNCSTIVNAGIIINEEHTPEAVESEYLTEGIMLNREGSYIFNAGDIDIGSEVRSGAVSNGGTIRNLATGYIYNYNFLIPQVKNPNGELVEENLVRGPVVNEGEIILGDNSMLLLDIENEGNAALKKEEGTIVVCDAENLALAVKMGGTVRLENDIVTANTIVINNTVTLDGDNNCLTGEMSGNATLLISGTNAALTEEVLIQNLIVCGPNTNPAGWDEGEYAVKVFWANNVTLDGVWMAYANAGLQVNSSTVTLMNDTCLAANEFGGIEVAEGADKHGASTLNIAEGATIMHIGNAEGIPAIWMDNAEAGTINDNGALLKAPVPQEDGKVYYYVKDSGLELPEVITMEGVTLKDSYDVNLATTREDWLEYEWSVNFTCGGQEYQVSTKHVKMGNSKPTKKTLQEMQTNLWKIDAEGNATVVQGVNVMLHIVTDTDTGTDALIWAFYRPEGMVGDFTRLEETIVAPGSV